MLTDSSYYMQEVHGLKVTTIHIIMRTCLHYQLSNISYFLIWNIISSILFQVQFWRLIYTQLYGPSGFVALLEKTAFI
jgi:hypothetical protein